MAELTYDEKLEKMREATEIEEARLRALGLNGSAGALADLRMYPFSMVRLYDILTKGAGNA